MSVLRKISLTIYWGTGVSLLILIARLLIREVLVLKALQ
jgi:hypothetical protein